MIDPPSLPLPAWTRTHLGCRSGIVCRYIHLRSHWRPPCDLGNQTACQKEGTTKPLISYGLAAHGIKRREPYCALPGLRNPSFEHSPPNDGLEAPGAPSGIGQAKPLHACQASLILRAISHLRCSIVLALQMFCLVRGAHGHTDHSQSGARPIGPTAAVLNCGGVMRLT